MTCGPGGSKSRLAKAAGAEVAVPLRHENLRATVARSTFPSQNAKKRTVVEHFLKLPCRVFTKTPGSEHFFKFRRRKIIRPCGAKHVFKSKYTKRTMLGPLFRVALLKNYTPLWREAYFQLKMYETHSRTTF